MVEFVFKNLRNDVSVDMKEVVGINLYYNIFFKLIKYHFYPLCTSSTLYAYAKNLPLPVV